MPKVNLPSADIDAVTPTPDAPSFEITLFIVSVADTFDAMTSNRVYRSSMDTDYVMNEMKRGRGTQFDPKFTDIMLDMIDEDTEYQMHE